MYFRALYSIIITYLTELIFKQRKQVYLITNLNKNTKAVEIW